MKVPAQAVAGMLAAAVLVAPAAAIPAPSASADSSPVRAVSPPTDPARDTSTLLEPWIGPSPYFLQSTGTNRAVVVSMAGTDDGKALRLQLGARPEAGPRQGATIESVSRVNRYGTYGSRMRTADCRGQDRSGVVTGTFVYSHDHSDANRNGLADNDEIDFEFHCSQPEVVWMTLWTDYDELRDLPRKISRAVNLRTGQVIYNCYLVGWTSPCSRLLPGENTPASVTAIPGFDSAKRFHTYTFDWLPNRVRFYASTTHGRRILLWDYRGPRSRIPQKPAIFMQNVWHTSKWDPFNGPARGRPPIATSAYLDSTTMPRTAVTRWTRPVVAALPH